MTGSVAMIDELIGRVRARYDGLNGPASAEALVRLEAAAGRLPADVLALYRDHDGSDRRARDAEGERLPGRLLPIDEVVEVRPAFECLEQLQTLGWAFAVLWTDDNSNYVGLYTGGPLAGFWFVIDHEEGVFTPAWRSATRFLQRVLDAAPGGDNFNAGEGEGEGDDDDVDVDDDDDDTGVAYDVVMVPRDIPVVTDDPAHVVADRQLVAELRRLYAAEADDDARRLLAQCAIALTPASDTGAVVSFLADPDIWTPESAVNLWERRRWTGNVIDLERLAREGRVNGDSAAMRRLVLMGTPESEAAVERLGRELTGQKSQVFEQWRRRIGEGE